MALTLCILGPLGLFEGFILLKDVYVAGGPLYQFARMGHSATVEETLESGVSPDTPAVYWGVSKYGEHFVAKSPLYVASRKGHSDVVELLLNSGADPEKPFSIGSIGSIFSQSALHAASAAGYSAVVKLLLKAGANPNMLLPSAPFVFRSASGRASRSQRRGELLLKAGATPPTDPGGHADEL